jgi:hypothetical protein
MFRRAGPELAAEFERWRSGRLPRHADGIGVLATDESRSSETSPARHLRS